ncbi:MAG: 4Fe-4S dicluster domain-containing protein [Deltaproteobacteria bacterium]|nr:4Fe-4S dicluster domain-containing protein [Deltaproteobacteria bacterium]
MDFWRMPIDAKGREVTLGKVNVIAYRCKGCKYCIEFCPTGVLAEAKEFNEKGYHPPYVKEEGSCKNCNYCETVCPEFAIFVTSEGRRELEVKDVLRTEATTSRSRRRRREG